MRILVVCHYWRPHRGGIESLAYEQGRRLVELGHRVVVVTSRLPGDPPFLIDEGIEVHRVSALNPLEAKGIPYPLFSPSLLPTLERLLRTSEVVLAHSHTFMPSVAAAVLGRRRGVPVIVFQQNTRIDLPFPWSVVQSGADALLGTTSLRLAARRLAASRESRRYAGTMAPGRNVSILYNGVDTARFHPVATLEERRRLRLELGLPEDAFIALTVRRLVFKNGLGTLVDAARRLASHRGLTIVVGGSGPERGRLDAQIREQALDQVLVTGFIDDARLPSYYRAADLFVLPSASGEGLPMVLLEAFASGLPVVGTRAGGQSDLIDDASTGWLIPPSDPDAMARAMADAYEHRDRTREKGVAARQLAETLDWDIHVAALVRHLESALTPER